jgi:3-hydroxymyristoyl/3-hydroxydecanoyl-(acyl carrier protein) dehydratase
MNLVSELRFPADHPAFAGHFPGHPIVPGVLLLDEALAAIAAQLGVSLDHCVLTAVKFRNVAGPGQRLQLRIESVVPGQARFSIESAGQAIAEGSLTFPVGGRDGGAA